MKISVERDILLKSLNHIQSVVERRNTIPILSNVLIEAHKGKDQLLDHYQINTTISNALQSRVDLPSGGYIIIEPTEVIHLPLKITKIWV